MSAESDSDAFSPEDLARLPEFYHPSVSPDGSTVALYYDGTGRNELSLLDPVTGERTQISDGDVPRNARWPILWRGDGEAVYFHRDEGGDEQNDVYRIDREGGVAQVVAVDGQAIAMDSSSDGRYLLYASDEGAQMNLYRYDTAADEREQLTASENPVYHGLFSPDDDRIAYAANETDDLENTDTYVMRADGSEKRKLAVGTAGTEVQPVDWGPAGDRLLVADNSADLGRAGIYHLGDDTVEWLGNGRHEESPAAFSPDGSRVVVTRQREAASMPVVYDLDGREVAEFDLPEGVASVAGRSGFLDDETVVLGHSTPSERSTLYAYDVGMHTTTTLLEPDYGDVDPDRFVDAEYVTYESADGLDIGALLFDARGRPDVDADATDQPAVVMVHGGPHGQSTKAFNLYAQFLVNKGYTVLQPNYRGSTGRGREFKNRIHGDWGGLEQADVAEGGRWLMAREWVDAERVAVFGGSYGGYSVYMQLVQYPELWATGIAWIGITDLHRLYEDSMPHFQTMLEQQLGDPEENHDLWRDRSAITHVDAIERPIFMVHGVNDPRCPVSQARIFRDALEERGWTEGAEFEYEELGEEGHGSTDTDQKLRTFSLLGDYLDRRL